MLDSHLHWAVFRHSHLYRLFYKGLGLIAGPPAATGIDVFISPEAAWRNVERIATLAEGSGAAFLLILSPPILPVCDADGNPMIPTPTVITEPLSAIRDQAEESGLSVLDLEPVFAPYTGRLKIAPQDHEHFNALGHRLAAGRLYRGSRRPGTATTPAESMRNAIRPQPFKHPHGRNKLTVIPHVVLGIVLLRREHQQRGVGGEIPLAGPHHRSDVQADRGCVETVLRSVLTIIDDDRARPSKAYQKLLKVSVSMLASDLAAGNVVDDEETLRLERQAVPDFTNRKSAVEIGNDRQLDDLYTLDQARDSGAT